MIEQQELIDYFENLAAQHKSINHDSEVAKKRAFLYGDVEMLLDDIGGLNTPEYTMLLEAGSGSLNGPDEVNLYDSVDVAFVICKAVPSGNRAAQRAIETACKNIGTQILKRIQHDRNEGTPEWLLDFRIQNVRYLRVFGFGNNHFGMRFEFELTDSAELTYNPELWSDEDEPEEE